MSTAEVTTRKLPDYGDLPIEENIEKAQGEIGGLALAEKLTDERMWEIAALAAAATPTTGTMAPGKTADPAILTAADYAEKIGWDRDLSTLQKYIVTYRKWQGIGRIEGCGFWTHYEFRNKPTELLPNTTYNEAKVDRSPEAAAAIIKQTLTVVPTAVAVAVTAEYLDTEEAGKALDKNEEAADHVFGAAARSLESIKRGKSKKTKKTKTLEEVSVVLELMIVLGKLRELAAEDPKSALVVEAKNLMRETLEILDGIEEASPEVVAEMIAKLEKLLAEDTA